MYVHMFLYLDMLCIDKIPLVYLHIIIHEYIKTYSSMYRCRSCTYMNYELPEAKGIEP